MKKVKNKLSLNKNVVSSLNDQQLNQVIGGNGGQTGVICQTVNQDCYSLATCHLTCMLCNGAEVTVEA